MHARLRLLALLALSALVAGCTTAADETWIDPSTGRVQTDPVEKTN